MGYQEFKLELPQVPRLRLKVLFFLHFLLISWATLGRWAELAYVIHNLLFLGGLIWSIALPHSEDAVFLTLIINSISVLLDIIILAIHYPSLRQDSTAEFSAVMGIFNLLLRFVTAYVLHTEWGDRGSSLPTIGSPTPKSVGPAEGGSVRSGSVLTHYPGQFDSPVPATRQALPPLPPSYSVNN